MACIINASTSAGLVQSADTSGNIQLQWNGQAAPAFSAYLNVTTAFGGVGWNKVTFDTELWDTNNNFASSRFTPTVAGYYQINSAVQITTSSTTETALAIYKNGSVYKQSTDIIGNPVYGLGISGLVYCNGSTDYIEIYMYTASSGKSAFGGSQYTWIDGSMVRGA